MLTEERYQIILDCLARCGSVTVAELSQRLIASESTVRRDLNALDALGKLTKVHGGATANKPAAGCSENPCVLSADMQDIARFTARQIKDNAFIFLDASAACLQLCEMLHNPSVTVVTNGLEHARRLARKGLRVLLPAGQVDASGTELVGAEAAASLGRYCFTDCYVEAAGISQTDGFTVCDPNRADILRAAIANSKNRYILADHERFDHSAPVRFASLEQGCIITDHLCNEAYKACTCIWEVTP